ncbi:MAG: hypothetical protein WAM68_17710, partial [Acidobacteriaceae bacterium]
AGSFASAAAMAWSRVMAGTGAAVCEAGGRDWAAVQAQKSAMQPERATSLDEAEDRNMTGG